MKRHSWEVPAPAVLVAVLALALFVLPVVALVQRAQWSSLWGDLSAPASRDAMRLSLLSSLLTTGLAIVLGVPLAWVLARLRFPGRAVVRALVILPMVLPPVVGGVALLQAFSRRGLLGAWLHDAFGIQFTFSLSGVVLAQTFVAMPFLVVTVEAGLRAMDRRYEDAASSLGARRWMVFRRVTLPLIAPSLLAGSILAWARALGEFGATITFAGNIQGRTQTMPLSVYLLLETRPAAAITLSLVLVAVSILVLVLMRDRWFGSMRRA